MYGDAKDVNTNTVVLKVDGNLTLDSSFILTSVAANNCGSKGLIIFCSGVLTINGSFKMSGYIPINDTTNVYLWRNSDGKFVWVYGTGHNGNASRRWYRRRVW